MFRRRRDVHVGVSAADSFVMSDSARAIVSFNPAATTDEKVAYLLRRDEDTQNRLADLDEALAAARTEADQKPAAATRLDRSACSAAPATPAAATGVRSRFYCGFA